MSEHQIAWGIVWLVVAFFHGCVIVITVPSVPQWQREFRRDAHALGLRVRDEQPVSRFRYLALGWSAALFWPLFWLAGLAWVVATVLYGFYLWGKLALLELRRFVAPAATTELSDD